jgi:hypothetical protein
MPFLLYTFQDPATGEIRDVSAASEAQARLRLGGVWTDRERVQSWTACDLGDLDKVLSAAMQEERRALDSALELNPHHPNRRGSMPDKLAAFAKAQDRHRKAKARVRELMRLLGALE